MKNVLIITDIAPQDKSGAGTNGNMHCRMINAIEGINAYTIHITNQHIDSTEHVEKVDASSKLEKVGALIRGYTPYLNNRALRLVIKTIRGKKISIVYVDNSISGQLIKKIKSRFPDIAVVSFFHDIEIVKMKEEKKKLSRGIKIALPVYLKNEQLTVKYADKTIVLNERDKKLFEKVYKKIPDAIIPISIPEIDNIPFEKRHKKNTKLKILFVGVEYGPNLSGVRWFLNKVLPNVSCDYEFNVVGYHMENYRAEFEKYSDKVHAIGTVDSLKEWYVDADLVVAPIFEGGGMKVKTAEALSYGKHFIGCTESLEGYWEDMPDAIRDEKVFKCDTPQEFAKAIDRAAKSEYDINDIEIKDWADSCYSYEANLKKNESIFEHI